MSESFAQTQDFFASEGINVCFYKISSSVTMYDLLAQGIVDFVSSNMDNAAWRVLNSGAQLSVVAGTDGARGYYLLGNSKVLGGYNSVAALQNQNIVVDSVDSGFIVGLIKILRDYGVTNYTFVPFASSQQCLAAVQAGSLNGISIAASMANNIAPYLVSYPVISLADQKEHFCPSQGSGYIVPVAWHQNSSNYQDLVKFFHAALRGYAFITDPANHAPVSAFIASNQKITDPNLVELQYNDYFNNPATGLNPYLTPRKAGLRNLLDARIEFGLSPAPASGVEDFLTNKPGGFVDLRALYEAQQSMGIIKTMILMWDWLGVL